MPDLTAADVERILAERAQGKLPTQIAAELNTPPPAPDDGPSDAERAAAAAESAMSGGATPAGEVPDKPAGVEMIEAAATAGRYVRPDGTFIRPAAGMSDAAFGAGVSVLFDRANRGDDDAAFAKPGETIAQSTERWRARERAKRGLA